MGCPHTRVEPVPFPGWCVQVRLSVFALACCWTPPGPYWSSHLPQNPCEGVICAWPHARENARSLAGIAGTAAIAVGWQVHTVCSPELTLVQSFV